MAVLLNSMRLLWFERPLEDAKLGRLRESFHRLDRWLEKYFDVDEALHWLSHQWRRVLFGGGVLLAVIWLLSGFTRIGPDENGIVLRFGKPVGEFEPGLGYCWPWPIDRVVRVQVDRIRTVPIGFQGGTTADKSGLAWESPHAGEERDDVAEQTLMITGDYNLVEVQATVRYRVDSRQVDVYLFGVQDADKIVRAATESILRTLVASRRLTDLLTTGRDELQREAIVRLKQRCADYQLGIQIEGFALHDLHPPLMVVSAYYEVTKAMELRDKAINDAKAEAVLAVGKAEADHLRRVKQAEVAKAKEIQDAQVRWAEYLAWSKARKQLSFDNEWRLFLDFVDDLHKGKAPEKAGDDYAARRRAALTAQREIVDRRLYWDRLGRALQGRDVLLIDAPQVDGRRTLLLFDLDPFRMPLLVPSEKTPPRPGGDGKNP